MVTIPVHISIEGRGKLPEYAHEGDSGFDFHAAIDKPITINPGYREAIPTGIKVAIPDGYELQVRSRSGLSLNKGLVVANSPGTVDSGFRGEIMVIMSNTDAWDAVTIDPGMKIAQGVLCPVVKAEFNRVNYLPDSDRGAKGLGSSGV